jgi:site-specific recombinase XerD
LTFLAVRRRVAASTQNQALSAILFLYRNVLKKELGWVNNVERAKKPQRVPVVFTGQEVKEILLRLDGTKWIMASLLTALVLGSANVSVFASRMWILSTNKLL